MYKMLLWSIFFRLGGIFIAPILSAICIALGRDKFFSFFHVLDNDEDGFDGDKRGWYSNYLIERHKSESLKERIYNGIGFALKKRDNPIYYILVLILVILYLPFYIVYCMLCTLDYWQEYIVNKNAGARNCNIFTRSYWSCRWNWRNQAFNHRYDDRCSVCVNPSQEPSFKIISFEGNTYHHEQRYSHEPSVRDKKWYKMVIEVKGKRHTSEFSLTPINGNEYEYKRKGLKVYPFYYFDKWWLNKIEKEGWPPHKDRAVYSSIKRVRKYKEEGA